MNGAAADAARARRELTAEQVTDVCTFHGEGPAWDAQAGALRFVDYFAGDVVTWRPQSGTISTLHVGAIAAVVRPRAGGGLVLALHRGFALLDAGASEPRGLGKLWTDPGLMMNDGGCDPRGRFYAGAVVRSGAPGAGALYRLDPDGTVTTVLRGVTMSNGLAWSPDGATAYYVDSPTRRVDAFAFGDDGELRDRRTFVAISPELGLPDGVAVDAEGGVWVVLCGGGRVHRYGPDGALSAVVRVPVRLPTACAFGGERLDELFVTTSRAGRADDDRDPAGAIFRVRPGVRGLPTVPFAG